MKKLIAILVIFTVVTVGSTAILNKMKKSEPLEEASKENTINVANDIEEIKTTPAKISTEKTIDMNATYNENNIKIETIDYVIGTQNVKTAQISGLKNKSVQDKINKKIKENTIPREYNSVYISANFSNVISISDNGNYRLTDGEELKFEDLFTKDADLKQIVRLGIYKELAKKQRDETGGLEANWKASEPYYNEQDKTWYIDVETRDMYGEIIKKETKEYVIPMTEYEIEKIVNKFMKNPKKIFSFRKDRIDITINDSMHATVFFKDIADQVAIYDKYLTTESLYEDDSRPSSFVACAAIDTKHCWTKYESNNFFYYVELGRIATINYSKKYPNKFINKKIDEEVEAVENLIEEYKTIAKNNPQKAYYLFVLPEINQNEFEERDIITHEINYYPNNLFSTTLNSKLITCDIEQSDAAMKKILEIFRYYNIIMHGNFYNIIQQGASLQNHLSEPMNLPVKETIDETYYDLLTGKKFTDWKEIFKKEYDPLRVVRNNIDSNKREKINDNVKIRLKYSGICLYDEKDNYIGEIRYAAIRSFLNLYEIKPEILPSSTEIISKDRVKSLEKDDMYRAYNELFARHGHDFQSEEYRFYFNLWDWYNPIPGKIVTVEELTDIEKQNYDTIKSVINEMEKV